MCFWARSYFSSSNAPALLAEGETKARRDDSFRVHSWGRSPASLLFHSRPSSSWCDLNPAAMHVKGLKQNISFQRVALLSQNSAHKCLRTTTKRKKRKRLARVSVWGLAPQRHAMELNKRQVIAPLMVLLSRGHLFSCEKLLIFRQKQINRNSILTHRVSLTYLKISFYQDRRKG